MIIDAINALPSLQQTVRDFHLSPQKKWGQNFLYDMNITHKIVRCAGDVRSGTVIEVGPGPGGLTRAILMAGATDVIAIDRDIRAVHALTPLVNASDNMLQVQHGNAGHADIWHMGSAPRHIIANLPYNVGTQLLLSWIKHRQHFAKMTLMFQKEVAERITAPQGHKHYGRLAVLCNWACHTQIAMTLPPSAFTPPPKVDSAVVTLIPRAIPLGRCSLHSLETITKAAFGQRRKMLRSSLKSLAVDSLALLEHCNIAATLRAEELHIQQFCALAKAYEAMV